MPLELVHRVDRHIDVTYAGRMLVRYAYRPQTPPDEAPKPFLHPVRTLSGQVVTGHRPHDHRWHSGISLAFSHVNGQNFWGGPSYVRDEGYLQIDNRGSVAHVAWDEVAVRAASAVLVQRLAWLDRDGQRSIDERRAIRVGYLNAAGGHYAIDVSSALRNTSGQELRIGSPTTNGRPAAGYGGWFWRGPRCFEDGRVVAADGLSGAESIMGAAAPWLAYTGEHDEVDAQSTLLFIDNPASARFPTKWFARSSPYAGVSFAVAFDEEAVLGPGEELVLRCRIAIIDGGWDQSQIEDYVGRYLTQASSPLSPLEEMVHGRSPAERR